jgi:uncharacterized damage-inducible protein DinB
MNASSIQKSWDYFRQCVGIGLRAVAALPEGSLDAHPVANMRTPKELVVHLFTMVREFPIAVKEGAVRDHDEVKSTAGIGGKAALLAWCTKAWEDGDAAVATLTDAQIGAMVKTPWGDHPGFVMMQILNDEFWHHRGQLYAYLRALGVEPAMLYDYEHNEAAFQPKEQAKA